LDGPKFVKKEIKKDSVAFLMPCGGPVEPRAVQSCMNLASKAAVEGFPCVFTGITDRTIIQTARNQLAKDFLERTDCEWAFWADSDMILEPNTIPIMIRWAKKLNAKMLTGIYYQRGGEHKPVIWNKEAMDDDGNIVCKKDDDYTHFFCYPGIKLPNGKLKIAPGGPPFRVSVAGFGCVLLHRDVFDGMPYPYFRFNHWNDEEGKIHESSEDFHFFVEAGKLGHDLWAVPQLVCGHIGHAPVITYKDCSVDLDAKTVAKQSLILEEKMK